jgi:hypothetical protein
MAARRRRIRHSAPTRHVLDTGTRDREMAGFVGALVQHARRGTPSMLVPSSCRLGQILELLETTDLLENIRAAVERQMIAGIQEISRARAAASLNLSQLDHPVFAPGWPYTTEASGRWQARAAGPHPFGQALRRGGLHVTVPPPFLPESRTRQRRPAVHAVHRRPRSRGAGLRSRRPAASR